MKATSFITLFSYSSSTNPLQISSSLRRRPRKNFIKPTTKTTQTPTSYQTLNLVIDVENIKTQASNSLNKFIYSGSEAFEDLKTLVTVDSNRRVLISCRKSSLWFLGTSLLWGFVVLAVFRVVLGRFGFWEYYHGGYGNGRGLDFVSKMDRSLGGREVVVGFGKSRKFKEKKKKNRFDFGGLSNPLSPSKELSRMENDRAVVVTPRKWSSTREELPIWWPDLVSSTKTASSVESNEAFQKEANRVIRAIMDNRMCGKDITEDDILQFRRICKASGARVYIETANARDSFYRASVEFVLNTCSSSARSLPLTQIDGEDAQQFVAGLADSIGLQNVRAARIVSAAVAAHTRSWFLQAWALEIQGNRAEALMELSKICRIHQIFPPKESSPEMEMVAQGLEKHFRVEQRKLLLNLLVESCGPPSRSAVEALGLINNPSFLEDNTRPLAS